ncbi:MAG: hypothetical protein ACXWUC_05175 [Methylosarcina sp.]
MKKYSYWAALEVQAAKRVLAVYVAPPGIFREAPTIAYFSKNNMTNNLAL